MIVHFIVKRNSDDSSVSNTSIKLCVAYGINLIESYLSAWNIRIRSIEKSDIKKLRKLAGDLCGDDMEDQLLSVLSDIKEYGSINSSFSSYTYNNQHRLTYILTSTTVSSTILGIVSAVVDYDDPTLAINIAEFYHSKLKAKDTLYIEIGCSNQSKEASKFAIGTNYFIRAYILLKAFEFKPIRLLWGSASGASQGQHNKLKDEHLRRQCQFVDDTNFYYCDPIAFLNLFFERLHHKDLLKHTEKSM